MSSCGSIARDGLGWTYHKKVHAAAAAAAAGACHHSRLQSAAVAKLAVTRPMRHSKSESLMNLMLTCWIFQTLMLLLLLPLCC